MVKGGRARSRRYRRRGRSSTPGSSSQPAICGHGSESRWCANSPATGRPAAAHIAWGRCVSTTVGGGRLALGAWGWNLRRRIPWSKKVEWAPYFDHDGLPQCLSPQIAPPTPSYPSRPLHSCGLYWVNVRQGPDYHNVRQQSRFPSCFQRERRPALARFERGGADGFEGAERPAGCGSRAPAITAPLPRRPVRSFR